MKEFENIQVGCYAGYKANEVPREFTYQDRRYKILEVLDRWYEEGEESGAPQLDYYKVKTDDNREYIIRYNHQTDTWSLFLPVRT
jgi:hypothetical protein